MKHAHKIAAYKEASAWGLLAGPLGHVATNALGRAAHTGSNLQSVLAHKGLQHALTDAIVNPGASRTVKSLLGPETLIPYSVAHKLGLRLKAMAPDQRAELLQNIYNRTHATKAPVLESLREAIGHELHGTAPTLQASGFGANAYARAIDAMTNIQNKPFDTGLQRTVKTVAGAAPLASLAVADPVATAAHAGINASRELIGNSRIGRRVTEELFDRGLSGQNLTTAHETTADLLLSPAVLDPYRAGKALRNEAPSLVGSSLTPSNVKMIKERVRPAVSNMVRTATVKTGMLSLVNGNGPVTYALPALGGYFLGNVPRLTEREAREYLQRDLSPIELALLQAYLSYRQGRSIAARRLVQERDAWRNVLREKRGGVPPFLQDTTLAALQGAGVEAITSDDKERLRTALTGGAQSAGAVIAEEAPWHYIVPWV